MITLPTTSNPLVVHAGTGRYVDVGDHRGYFTVSAQTTGGALSIVETEVDPHGGVPPHIHRREDETFYILSGRFTFGIGEETIDAGPGDSVFAPRNLAHTWQCISAEGGRMLVLLTPGDNFEAFAIEMAEHGIVPSDPASLPKLLALAERYGIEMLPPNE